MGPGASLEQRVSGLELNVDALAREQGQLSTALTQETAKREEELASERNAMNNADTRLQNKLQELGPEIFTLNGLAYSFLFWG